MSHESSPQVEKKQEKKNHKGCIIAGVVIGAVIAGDQLLNGGKGADAALGMLKGKQTEQSSIPQAAASSSEPKISTSTKPKASASVKPKATTSAKPKPTESAKPKPTAKATHKAAPTVKEAAPVIVLDPGHSGKDISSWINVPGGGKLRDHDYPEKPEIFEAFDISKCVSSALVKDGYKTTLTKHRVLQNVSLKQRADIANRAHADLAISIHDDHTSAPDFQAVYSQYGTGGKMYRGSKADHNLVTFDNDKVAKESQAAAKEIMKAREEAQGRDVKLAVNQTYVTRNEASKHGDTQVSNIVAPGNLAMVQLFSDVPFVYNEMGARAGNDTHKPISISAETKYATGLYNGIEDAVPYADGHAGLGGKAIHSCLVSMNEQRPEKWQIQ